MGKRLLAFCLAFLMLMDIPALAITANAQTLEKKGAEYSTGGTTSFGTMLSEEIDSEIAAKEATDGNFVSAIEMTGKKASVKFATTTDSTLVIAIFDEEGTKMLGSGSVDVDKTKNSVEVDVEIDTVPQYFMVRGYLVDRYDLKPLSTVYNCPLYTREMQEFLEKTVDDFDEDQVLNLDENDDTNFAVFGEGTIIIPYVEGQNVLTTNDSEANRYVIEQATSEFTSLQRGDLFAYNYDGQNFLITEVDTITVNGTTVTITGAELEMEEVFDYVKIESEAGLNKAVVNNDNLKDGLIYEGMFPKEEPESGNYSRNNYEDNLSGTDELKYTMDEMELKDKSGMGSVKVSGSVVFTTSFSLKYYFSMDYRYTEIIFQYEAGLVFTLEGAVSDEFEIGEISFYPIPGVELGVKPILFLEAKVELTAKVTIAGQLGIRYDDREDTPIENLSTNPEVNPTIEGTYTITAGVKIEPFVGIIDDDILKLSISFSFGGEITSKLFEFKANESDDEIHECERCVEGEVNMVLEIGAEVEFLNRDDLKIEKKFTFKAKLTDFYISLSKEDSGLTTCPYKKLKRTVYVKDVNGNPIENASIREMTLGDSASGTTDDDGKWVSYRPANIYVLRIEAPGFKTKTITRLLVAGGSEVSVTMQRSQTIVIPEEPEEPDVPDDPEAPEESKYVDIRDIVVSGNQYIIITEDDKLLVHRLGEFVYQMSDVEWAEAYKDEIIACRKDGSLYIWDKYAHPKDPILTGVSEFKYLGVNNEVSAVLLENGDLYVWGSSDEGLLGFGDEVDYVNEPTLLMSNVREFGNFDYGSNAVYVITESGDLYTWGYAYDLIGAAESSSDYYAEPVCILQGKNVVSFKTYQYGLMRGALTQSGDLYLWGYSEYDGVLPCDKYEYCFEPTFVMSGVADFSLGSMHVFALMKNKDLYMWGVNYPFAPQEAWGEPAKIESNVKDAKIMHLQYLVLKDNGDLYQWGDLGDFDVNYVDREKILTQVEDITIYDAYAFTAETTANDFYVWGDNGGGKLGLGSNGNVEYPVKYAFKPENFHVTRLGSGSSTSADGKGYVWGNLAVGVTADSYKMTEILVPKPTYELNYEPGDDYKAKSATIGYQQYAVLMRDGSLYQFSNPKNNSRAKKILRNVKEFSYEASSYIALTKDNDVYTWKPGATPQKAWEGAKKVAAGSNVYAAIGMDNALYVWSSNPQATTTTPTKVLENVVDVAVGQESVMALTSSGDLYVGKVTTESLELMEQKMTGVKKFGTTYCSMYYAINNSNELYLWGGVSDVIYSERGNITFDDPVCVMSDVADISYECYEGSDPEGYKAMLILKTNKELYAVSKEPSGSNQTGTEGQLYEPVKIMDDVAFMQDTGEGFLAVTTNKDAYFGIFLWTKQMDEIEPRKILENVVEIGAHCGEVSMVTGDGKLYFCGPTWHSCIMSEGAYASFSIKRDPYVITIPVASQGDYEQEVVVVQSDTMTPNISGNSGTSKPAKERNTQKTMVFEELGANEICNVYIVKDSEVDKPLSAQNLLYIDQRVSSADGTLKVTFDASEYTSGYEVIVASAGGLKLENCDVSIPSYIEIGEREVLTVPITVRYQGETLMEGSDYELSGDVEIRKAGKYTVTVKGMGRFAGTRVFHFEIFCKEHRYVFNGRREATCYEPGWISFRCIHCGVYSGTNIAPGHKYLKVRKSATLQADGVEHIRCLRCKEESERTISKISTISLSYTAYNYIGTAKTPVVTVKDTAGKVLTKNTDYKVSYQNNVNVGEATAVITFKGDYAGTVKKTFTIKPKGTTIQSLTAASAAFTAKWNLQKTQTTGYEVQYSTTSNFTASTTKTVAITSNATSSKQITGLKKKQKYYVRIRTYRVVTVSGKQKKIYSDWSASKTVTTK